MLKLTVHGLVTVDEACYGNTVVYTTDAITNKIVGSIPELNLHIYSVILCPLAITVTGMNTRQCLYSIYITEKRNGDDIIVNSRLTRASVAVLHSHFSSVSIFGLT